MLIYVVPTLTATFKDLNVKLPVITRFGIALSDFLQTNFAIVLSGLIVAGAGFYYGVRTNTGKRIADTIVLKLPVIAPMTREINSARTARTLSSLLSSGVDVVVALGVTRDVVQNSYYKEVLIKAEKAIEQGKSISTVIAERGDLYPAFVSEMVAVGEETGKMGDMLLGVATFYEEEVDQKTKNLSTIIEPILMVIIGTAVGFFAMAMLAPTYSLVDAI
jgi:type IV pilus assembly protein PilC